MDTEVYEWMKYLIKPECILSVDNPKLDKFMRKLKQLLYHTYA
jgi:hypothetical protein